MSPWSLAVVLVVVAVLASLAHSLALASSTLVEAGPLNHTHLLRLEQAVVEMAEGPLRDKWIVLIIDSSADQLFSLKLLLDTLYRTGQSKPLFLVRPDIVSDWQNQLPPPSIFSGRCTIILITGTWTAWLEEAGNAWTPATMIIVNVNTTWDATLFMESPQIQKSASLALLEDSHTNGVIFPHLFTSRYFSRTHQGERLSKDILGPWDKSKFPAEDDLFPDRFQTFGGEVLHVASDLDDYPLIYEDGDSVDGTNIRILESLGSWLNFTYTLTRKAQDDNWGELENGTWNGLLGEVYAGTKNITINYFTVVEERLFDFDFTATYFYEGFGFAMRVPPPLPAWMSLTYPFQPLLWVSVCGSLLVTTPSLFLVNRLASSEMMSLQDAAFIIFGSLVRQSGWQGSRVAVRLVLAGWWLGGLILVVSYTCNLIAVLTVPVFPPTISTIEALALSDFRVAMVDYGEFVPEALATSKDRHLKALGDRMDLVFNYDDDTVSYNELLQLALAGRHAITETYSYLRNMIREDVHASQETYMLREQIYSGALAFFLPKHTPWRLKLDEGIRGLVEGGLVDKWYSDIMGGSSVGGLQPGPGKTTNKPLSLSNLQGPFFLLGYGLVAAVLAFLKETVAHLRHETR